MLTETTNIDRIEVIGELRHVHVRTAIVVKRDNVEIAREYFRKVIAPGENYSDEPAEVKAVCDAVHTPEIVAAYMAFVKEQE